MRLLPLAILILLAAPAHAQTTADDADHDALRTLGTAVEAAIRDNKIETLAPLLSKDFHGVMVTGQVVNNLNDLRGFWAGIRNLMGPGGRYTTSLNPERSVIVGDLALARGTSDDEVVTSGGMTYRFNMHWTAVLQKEDGQWKLRQAHGSIDPINNAFVRAFTQRAILMAAVVSGVVGLIAGAAVAMLIGRRRRVAVA